MTAQPIPSHWSERFEGIPYAADGGRDAAPGAGLNCWTFFCYVMRVQFGVEMPLVSVPAPASGRDATGLRHMLEAFRQEAFYSGWQPVPAAPREGDALVLGRKDGYVDHIGLVIALPCDPAGSLRLLHADRGFGSRREPLSSVEPRWRFREFWRQVKP